MTSPARFVAHVHQQLAAPGFRLLLIIALGIVAAACVTALSLRTPWLGLQLTPATPANGLHVAHSDGPGVIVTPGSLLLSVSPAGFRLDAPGSVPHRIELRASDAIEDPGMLPSFAAVHEFYHRQAILHDTLQGDRVQLDWVTPSGSLQTGTLTPLPTRPLSSLPAVFWVQVLSGVLGLAMGCWVWVLRPHDWAARWFAVTGAMMLVFTLPAAWYSTRELALEATLFGWLSGINISGAILFGCALIAIFLSFPRQLVRPAQLVWLPVVFGSLLVAELLQWWPRPMGNLITLAQTLVAVGCALWQWRANRSDPTARAALRWVGLSALLGAALFVVPQAAAPLIGTAPPVSQGLGFAFFLIMYAGIALGVARYRLFELDEWAFRILIWVLGVLLLLAVDALLIWVLHLTPALSLGLALLVVGFLYLPLRNRLWERLVSRPALGEDALFRSVLDVVLEPQEADRRQRYHQLLQNLFAPLEIREHANADLDGNLPRNPQAIRLTEDGLALELPAAAGSPPLTLRYPWRGRGLFNRVHERQARRILAFLAQADIARADYQRGVTQERARIRRDLHDDIGARLVTSLHLASEPGVQNLLRQTLQDLRIILTGLAGDSLTVPQLLDRLQAESQERLQAAGIELRWVSPTKLPDRPVRYGVYKNLISAHREVISNIIRHSTTGAVTVQIGWHGGMLHVDTCDHPNPAAPSAGAQTNALPSDQLGLDFIRQRLNEAGGDATIQLDADGSRVVLTLPLPDTAIPSRDSADQAEAGP